MRFEFSVLFTLKKSKVDRKGEVPVYVIIIVNGERAELSVNRKVDAALNYQ